MRNCFQYPLEGLSETSNNQALLIPFIITWKWGKVLSTGKFWLYSYGWDMRNCFQYPLEGHSEFSNGQALLNPFYHYIKMKEYIKVEVGGGVEALYPGVDCPHLPHVNSDYVYRDEIWELFPVSSWRAFRNFKWPGSSQSLWSLHKNESIHEGWGGGVTFPWGRLSPPHLSGQLNYPIHTVNGPEDRTRDLMNTCQMVHLTDLADPVNICLERVIFGVFNCNPMCLLEKIR